MIAYKLVTYFPKQKRRYSWALLGKEVKEYKIKSRNYPDEGCDPLCCFCYIPSIGSSIVGESDELWKVKIKKSRKKRIWNFKFAKNGFYLKKNRDASGHSSC